MNTNPETSLVIIEDNPNDLAICLKLIEKIDYQFEHIHCFSTLESASKHIQKHPPTCCLLDFFLPDGDALTLLENFEKNELIGLCPFVVITGQEDTRKAVKIMKHGASDYLSKDTMDSEKLFRAIQQSIRTWKLQQQLNKLALYDVLTGLANRALFIDHLKSTYQEHERYNRSFALAYIDLDRFKIVNDTYGHEAGDFLLESFSTRLTEFLRSSDIAARLGGDEFGVLFPNLTKEKAHFVAHKLVHNLTFDIQWKESTISTSPSIGVAIFPSHAGTYQDLIREADYALYQAKKAGRGRYAVFNSVMQQETKEFILLSTSLPHAIRNEDLTLAYQPIVSLKDQSAFAVEALVRWNFQDRWVCPSQIVELILERKLNTVFHEWLFTRALNQLKLWQEEKTKLKMSINVPANLFYDAEIVNILLSKVRESSIDPSTLSLEVTETHFMQHPEDTLKRLFQIADQGIQISIDDFGTGYSSMQYLANLPCDLLKIDKKFFLDLHLNNRNEKIIEGVTALAHRLEMKVVAEGIESKELYNIAKRLGCDFAQGFYTGSPHFATGSFEEFYIHSLDIGHDITKAHV